MRYKGSGKFRRYARFVRSGWTRRFGRTGRERLVRSRGSKKFRRSERLVRSGWCKRLRSSNRPSKSKGQEGLEGQGEGGY